MGYSHITITYNPDSQGYIKPSFSPSDALTVGLNVDGTFVLIDNGDFLFENETGFYIFDKPYGSHTNNYGTFTITSGVQYSVASLFGSAAQPGRYIWIQNFSYPELSNIPLVASYTNVGLPSSPTLSVSISREPALLSWGASSAGTSNNVTGYDVQYRDSTDGIAWSDSWTTVSGSPVTITSLSVSPPDGIGHYRQFRVRARGSAGESYYSDWVISSNTLRRKWNTFDAWTDSVLTAKETYIRAVHLSEIQTNVNVIRSFYGLGNYAFTTVQAGVTKISKWADLIQEIRDAIDDIDSGHESWNLLESGKPRIAHITQQRSIVDSF